MLDAIAWIDGPNAAEQIESLDIEGGGTLLATGRTLRKGVNRDELDVDLQGGEHDA